MQWSAQYFVEGFALDLHPSPLYLKLLTTRLSNKNTPLPQLDKVTGALKKRPTEGHKPPSSGVPFQEFVSCAGQKVSKLLIHPLFQLAEGS